MGENTAIEWAHHTFNPWRGCTKVSPGCANCYAERMSHRNPKVLGEWGPGAPRVLAADSYWKQPLAWNRAAEKSGERHRVFCASLADWLDDAVPVEWLARLLGVIDATPHLDWLLLTKRPQNWRARLGKAMCLTSLSQPAKHEIFKWLSGNPPPNVWVGTSVEDQQRADERIPHLLSIPAAVRFLSCEPLLGPVDMLHVKAGHLCPDPDHRIDILRFGYWDEHIGFVNHSDLHDLGPRISWVIVGGESGPKARPMHPDWARGIRDQCEEAGVAFHFKQWGEWRPMLEAIAGESQQAASQIWGTLERDGTWWESFTSWNGRQDGDSPSGEVLLTKFGKKAAGRILDGRTWDQLPAGASR